MQITPHQIIQIQSACSRRFSSREERLEFFSDFFGYEIKSTKDLSSPQAQDLVYYLNTGKQPNDSVWAWLPKNASKKHKYIYSLCHQISWVQKYNPTLVDTQCLGSWLKSKRSPVNKPIREMNEKEVSKIITALEGIQKSMFR